MADPQRPATRMGKVIVQVFVARAPAVPRVDRVMPCTGDIAVLDRVTAGSVSRAIAAQLDASPVAVRSRDVLNRIVGTRNQFDPNSGRSLPVPGDIQPGDH